MTDEDGHEVDVDLISHSHTAIEVKVFDVWRIKSFLSSNGYHPLTNEELNAACEQLAACGELLLVDRGMVRAATIHLTVLASQITRAGYVPSQRRHKGL